MKRSPFPRLFWVGNTIEIFERLAYYGLYMGFQVYATTAVVLGGLGWSKMQLGWVQTLFLVFSYGVPMVSGVLADRYGFKRMLIVSYLLYLPGFLFLIVTKQFFGVLIVMSLIGIAAGVFKPLIAGTVRLTTDETNRTLGFGIFYQMVNVGAFFGPLLAGALRTITWNYAFLMSSAAVLLMLIGTALFYRNPIEVEADHEERPSLTQHIKEILPFLKDPKILVFIVIFGVFIESPFWAFFNVIAMYADTHVAMDRLYNAFSSVLGTTVVGWISTTGEDGVRRIAGETMSHTALWIIIFQLMVTRTTEKLRSVPTVAIGIFGMVIGCIGLYASAGPLPGLLFAGSLLFAVGEMACMPRFEQFLICMLPPEKTGLGGGLLRIPVVIGAIFSGMVFTPLYGYFENQGIPEAIWIVVGGSLLVGFFGILAYDKIFKTAD
ncbi:MAG: peptide MFS transporter [bacterium]|nr:peptide MFS transporter [bacterium]